MNNRFHQMCWGVKVSKPGDKSIQPGASGEGHFG